MAYFNGYCYEVYEDAAVYEDTAVYCPQCHKKFDHPGGNRKHIQNMLRQHMQVGLMGVAPLFLIDFNDFLCPRFTDLVTFLALSVERRGCSVMQPTWCSTLSLGLAAAAEERIRPERKSTTLPGASR